MNGHTFIFSPGIWMGEASVRHTGSQDSHLLRMRWQVGVQEDPTIVCCSQRLEVVGMQAGSVNCFRFQILREDKFEIELSNDVLGTVRGQGIRDDRLIAWEFSRGEPFEGYEVYELKNSKEYLIHAEYVSLDQVRTLIDGTLKKISDVT